MIRQPNDGYAGLSITFLIRPNAFRAFHGVGGISPTKRPAWIKLTNREIIWDAPIGP